MTEQEKQVQDHLLEARVHDLLAVMEGYSGPKEIVACSEHFDLLQWQLNHKQSGLGKNNNPVSEQSRRVSESEELFDYGVWPSKIWYHEGSFCGYIPLIRVEEQQVSFGWAYYAYYQGTVYDSCM